VLVLRSVTYRSTLPRSSLRDALISEKISSQKPQWGRCEIENRSIGRLQFLR